jgi:hypothetical protein
MYNVDPEELLRLADSMDNPMKLMLEYKQICDRFHRGKDAKLAQIVQSIRLPKETGESVKTRALASSEWQSYLKDYDMAERNYIQAKITVDTLSNRFSALQSIMAYMRDGMRRGVL